MRRFHLLLLTLAALLFCQCSNKEAEPFVASFNEYVSAYTSGSVPRKAEIQVVFSQDIPQNILQTIKADDVMKISPKAEGTFSFADARTLVFKPTTELSRNTLYNVSVGIPVLFDGGEVFQFAVRTRPFAISGSMKSFVVTDEDYYELHYQLLSADSETPETIEKHLTLNMQAEQTWTHAADGLSHQLKLRLKPNTTNTLRLNTIADKALGNEAQEIAAYDLPSADIFALVDMRCKAGDSKCIEVIFNKNLDKQDVQGLVYIGGEKTEAVVEGNKVMLYGNLANGRTVTVTIDKTLRSRSGQTLPMSVSRNISISTGQPDIEFVGNGNIIPQSEKILVPFRSIYMRGVRVMVFKVFDNMMGNMLTGYSIDESYRLTYMARPIAATTFYMDEPGIDLTEWHTFAIDLTEQFRVEPGAMYRIELTPDARLSAWPSDSLPKATREELAAEDAQLLEMSNRDFDTDDYYSNGMVYRANYYASEYYWERRNNPSFADYYRYKTIGKQVLSTNIGLTALRGSDNSLQAIAMHLPDALPMNGVSIEAYNRQQQLLGSGKTDKKGVAKIDYQAQQGAPAYLVARKGNDVSYLRVGNDQSLSTSTFDVSGAVIERGLKGYLYGDRGVWRPGDTLHIGFMLNDPSQTLPHEHPVTLQLSNPLGQICHRATRTTSAMGLYTFSIPTADDAPTGIWAAQIQVGGVTFRKNLRIEAIKPNRLKINLELPQTALTNGSNSTQLSAEWLNGNVASGLKYDITATITESKTTWKNYPDYVFDDPTKRFETSEQNIAKGEIGASGTANVNLNLNVAKTAPGMLRANLVTHLYEPSGEFSVDVNQVNIAPYSHFVGIKAPKQADQQHLDTDKNQVFDIVCVDKDGQAVGGDRVKVTVYKVDWYWWWSSSRNDMVGYTSSSYNTPVYTCWVNTNEQGQGNFTLCMNEANWGTYLIVASNLNSGHSASTLSYFDWPWMTSRRSSDATENAIALSINTDKKEYAPGEKIRLNIPSEEGSYAIVSISNGSRILHLDTYACQKERTQIDIEATEEMTPNIYVGVSLVQPYEQTLNDMPIRMYGYTPLTITSAKSHLHPKIGCDNEWLPESTQQLTVSEQDGRPMAYTLAIVDEGLLDLTHFKTPDAWPVFNAREALGVRHWDMYSLVNGAYGGRIEQMYSIGGDEALGNSPKAIVNRFRPMVHFAGPFVLKKGGKNTHKIPVPNYNGRVRIMVVAGDGQAYGNAEQSVLVRRPLMLVGTMPRQIGSNDEMTVSATLFATQALGDVKVSIASSASLKVIGNDTQTVHFAEAGDKTIQFRMKASSQADHGTVSIKATAGSHKADYTANIDIRTVSQTQSRTTTVRIDPGKNYEQEISMPGDDNYQLMVDASTNQPLNLMSRLSGLIAYPHGCVEQSTSKVFPQLYLADFANLSAERQNEVESNIKNCINRMSLYQTADGGMSYWPGGRHSNPWASAYVLHFLSEASARGYYVPDNLQKRLKNYVTAQANAWTSKENSTTAAYQLWILANIGATELGTMNRMREYATDLPINANYLLAATYALAGRQDIARELYDNANGNETGFWFSTRVARLLAQMQLNDVKAHETAEQLRKNLTSELWLSTSECANTLYALSKFYKQNHSGDGLDFAVEFEGTEVAKVKSNKYCWTEALPATKSTARLKVKNNGQSPLYLTTTAQGIATQSHIERTSNGLELTVRYATDLDQPLDPSSLEQNTTFKAVLSVRNTSGTNLEHIAVTHILPAGWEILSSMPSGNISYQDQRDDRLLSYIDQLHTGEAISITMKLSATYAGSYYLPAVSAEAMYDATLSGCTESGQCVVK